MLFYVPEFPDTLVGVPPFREDGLYTVFYDFPDLFQFIQCAGKMQVIVVDHLYQVAHEALGCRLMPHLENGFDGHGGVSYPAEAVVPVPDFADCFRDAGRQCGDHRARGLVRHEFQDQQASENDFVVLFKFSGTVVPVQPIYLCTLVFQINAVYVDGDEFLVVREYLATKRKQPGVLILSEMAGTSIELPDAIVVNPTDVTGKKESGTRSWERSGGTGKYLTS